MLALNSYGCAARPAPLSSASNNNQQRHDRAVVLPRLVLHGARAGASGAAAAAGLSPTPPAFTTNSLTKLEMMRANAHPLYRTTTSFDYGRHLDFKDVALSCPKHAKPAKFTKEFIAGTFTDSSLASIDKSRQRHECWQLKVAERTKQMQAKYDELQHVLEGKRETRRLVRDQRRRELREQHRAAARIQARVRGWQVRARIANETLRRHTVAAVTIQQACRSHAEVRRAQQLLQSMKQQRLDVFAVKIQSLQRNYALRAAAKRELQRRREQKLQDAEGLQRRIAELQDDAARDIQRALRSHMARKLQRQFSTTSSSSDKDDLLKDLYYAVRGGKSRLTRKTLASLKRPKRDKSVARLSLGSPK